MNDYERIPIPRENVFVLKDGSFVVQWEDNQVQDLLTGKYRHYLQDNFGTEITDYELTQLKNKGVVAAYDSTTVFLFSSPDITPRMRGRSYYLNTTLLKTQVHLVQQALENGDLAQQYAVRVRDDFVVIWAHDGVAFENFDDAEAAREQLLARVPDLLQDMVVAFVEITS